MSNKGFLEALSRQIIIGDGAMGTYIYAKGIPLGKCYDELNLTMPHLIKQIHKEYVSAGAELIETNTFTANRFRLERFELAKKVREINIAGVKLAKEAAVKDVYVAGSVGPLTSFKKDEELSNASKTEIFAEQIEALAEGGCDVLILETFTDVAELKIALKVAKSKTKLPVICQMTFSEHMRTHFGVTAREAISELEKAGADVVGTNCGVGPLSTSKVVEEMGSASKAKISVFPNAGMPEYHDGRYMYLSTPEYIAKMAQQMVNSGANLVGGCCGTTPADIKAIVARIKGTKPIPRRIIVSKVEVEEKQVKIPPPRKKTFIDKLWREPLVVIELDPPKDLDFAKVIKGARRLKEAGVDAITVGDNPLATLRMGNIGIAHLMEKEKIPTIAHISCRDKNLIGLQSTIMEAYAMGVTSLLAITGDPAKVGDQPGAASVYDLNSFELIHLIRQMNEGKNYSGDSIGSQTNFSIGCAFNPNVKDIDMQIRRLVKKIDSGAQYALSQPFYDINAIEGIYDKIKKVCGKFPVFFGVLPLVSARNAEFLNAEVPGIKIPDAVISRMKEAPEKSQRDEGIVISKELIDKALDYAPGIYIIPPFGSVKISLELLQHINLLKQKRVAKLT